ncbi:MAG TPA: glycerol-3-phosphate dehydrogenase/oxidase [Aggregatilineales bacterium]|nr:glycerol-3-phosphate dehydrogenase/oxidase [Anaerolineales bacterium]HRE47920.1 glycerol-3-phosphate dehydrogenase/oxidase [Aggregatilineales bacterium]
MIHRSERWERLKTTAWDVLVIGGGITGAGILHQAARLGLRASLIERRDFAWGTSSRSSKMVHGGLRYLKTGDVQLTYESVRERGALLNAAPGLVEELGFLIATYAGDTPGALAYRAGLSLYDVMATGERRHTAHSHYSAEEFLMLAPHLRREGLLGGFRYVDAQTDDARLVMRVLNDADARGALALNYCAAERLIREGGRVVGVNTLEGATGEEAPIRARVVIAATGAWADDLRGQVGAAAKIRPLRGSHLVIPAWRLPVAQVVSFAHPLDGRPVFVYPWEGVTLIGTTDVDHHDDLRAEPRISPEEVSYLLAGALWQFPAAGVTLDDVIGTWAGVRPVVGTGKADPSKESRDYAVWDEEGLITVTGGKLTTFRLMALDALAAAHRYLPDMPEPDRAAPPIDPNPPMPTEDDLAAIPLSVAQVERIMGRYSTHALEIFGFIAAHPEEAEPIPGTLSLWAELRHSAHCESVQHLDDLLLRRTRIGMLLPRGGVDHLPRIRAVCQRELGWDDGRWAAEEAAYQELWAAHYSVPDRALISDPATLLRGIVRAKKKNPLPLLSAFAVLIGVLGVWLLLRPQRG